MNLPIRVHLGEGGPTPYLPLSEIAPLVRREVVVDPDESYTELGVRSFHKGTFHRRTIKGVAGYDLFGSSLARLDVPIVNMSSKYVGWQNLNTAGLNPISGF